jgi:hypothetical protein
MRNALIGLLALTVVSIASHTTTAQGVAPANQSTVTVYSVSSRLSPGGPVGIANYGEDGDLAERTAKSLRESRGINGEQLYFDVKVIKTEVPASSSPSTRRTPQGPIDAPSSGSPGGKPGGAMPSLSSNGSAAAKPIDPTAKDKQWVLWTQKKVNGTWQVQGTKQRFDDYASFYAAYQTTTEQVDAANNGLPGVLYSVGWEEVKKPNKIEFQNIPSVDPGSKPAQPYNPPRIGFDDSMPKGQKPEPNIVVPDKDSDTRANIVGKWTQGNRLQIFSEDGSFRSSSGATGKWTFQNGKIYITFNDGHNKSFSTTLENLNKFFKKSD